MKSFYVLYLTIAIGCGLVPGTAKAQAAGMRAIVLKNHYTATADRAWLAMRAVPGIEVFGGVALNRAVGGVNAEAVLRMAQMEGRRGRIVWLPTWDARHWVTAAGETRPSLGVVIDGWPVPELADVFRVAAEYDLVIATGHAAAEESLVLIDAARAAGVKHVLVTHALAPQLAVTDDRLREMVRRGATIELVWLQHHPPAGVPVARAMAAIRSVGAEHVVIASDFGQATKPSPPEGLRAFIEALRAEGITPAEIDLMVKRNPARLLGLSEEEARAH
jgi:type IV secretory pathway TrbD component